MSAGTLTLTNNSTSVSGSGTAFSTELAAGDFIVVTVGGVPYTLPIKAVNSNTSLTLVSIYTGPTQSGAAWFAVPRAALNMVTAALVAQSAEALRGLNYDKQNWQQVFSGTGTVTVKLPDGTTYTGPAWNSLITALDGKAAKGANSDIKSLSGLTTPLSVAQGGTGANSAASARINFGFPGGIVPVLLGGTGATTADNARGNLSAAGSGVNSDITNMTGVAPFQGMAQAATTLGYYSGTTLLAYNTAVKPFNMSVITSNYTLRTSFGFLGATSADTAGPAIICNDATSYVKYWYFINGTGVIQTPSGNITPAVSDIRVKDQKKVITEDEAVNFIQGWESILYTLKWSPDKLRIGFRAQDIFDRNPDLIDRAPLSDGEGGIIDDGMVVDVAEVASGYLVPVVQKLLREVNELKAEVKELKGE